MTFELTIPMSKNFKKFEQFLKELFPKKKENYKKLK